MKKQARLRRQQFNERLTQITLNTLPPKNVALLPEVVAMSEGTMGGGTPRPKDGHSTGATPSKPKAAPSAPPKAHTMGGGTKRPKMEDATPAPKSSNPVIAKSDDRRATPAELDAVKKQMSEDDTYSGKNASTRSGKSSKERGEEVGRRFKTQIAEAKSQLVRLEVTEARYRADMAKGNWQYSGEQTRCLEAVQDINDALSWLSYAK